MPLLRTTGRLLLVATLAAAVAGHAAPKRPGGDGPIEPEDPICGDGLVDEGEDCDAGAEGYPGCCTTDCRFVDADGDGYCDAEDVCPTVANPGQEDSDGNAIGDACTPCAGTWFHQFVAVGGVNDGRTGDETLRVRGVLRIPDDVPQPMPSYDGAWIVVRSLHGEPPITVEIPAGDVDELGAGWRVDTRGRRYAYTDGDGRTRMRVRMQSDGGIAIDVVAKHQRLDFGPWAFPPLAADVGFGVGIGVCGPMSFVLDRCTLPPNARSIVCR